MKESSFLSLKNILKIASVICYCSITLNGECGVSVLSDLLFRLIGVGFLSTLLSLAILYSLTFLIVTIFKKNRSYGMPKYILIGVLLIVNLFVYCDQPQEHANPFDLPGSFLWTVFLFLCLYTAIGIEIYKEKQTKGANINA